MCGLTGELNFSRPPNREAVRAMTGVLSHRGPDAEGFHGDEIVALGHRRLSILDIAGGVQPMCREGCVLVFNGQAYDHDELRRQLGTRGHVFTTRSDTEVVLRAYLEWGEHFAEHLHGMFAIAIWDPRSRKLVLARDRLGKKPLYYAAATGCSNWRSGPCSESDGCVPADRLVFASELKALMAHGDIPRELAPQALVQYLAAECVPAPLSILRHVHKLPAGHVAVLDSQGLRLRRYWELPAPSVGGRPLCMDEAAEQLRGLLDRAVKKRLVADVPVGVFLSGGVDSTTITALAARHKHPLSTFSIGFSEGSFDESPFAELAAKHIGTDHHNQKFSGHACVDLLPEAVASLDEPFADPSFLPTLLLSRFTRQSVTVALAGDGGDELFAGYDPFLAHRPARMVAELPAFAIRALQRGAALLPSRQVNMSLDFRVKQFLRGVEAPESLRHQAWIASLLPQEIAAVLRPELRSHAASEIVFGPVLEEVRRGAALGVRAGSVDEALRFYTTRYLIDDILVKADRASMAASLEVRAPFLDTAVVEFAVRLPWELKLSWGKTKRVLKHALAGLVPQEILARPKKGFGIPAAAWIRGPLRPLFEDLFSADSLRHSEVFDAAEARRMLDRHLSERANLRKPLWTLAMFLLWQRQWLRR